MGYIYPDEEVRKMIPSQENPAYAHSTGPSEALQEVFEAKTLLIRVAIGMGDLYRKVWFENIRARISTDEERRRKAQQDMNQYLEEAYGAVFISALAISHIFKESKEYKAFHEKLFDESRIGDLNHLWDIMAEAQGFLHEGNILDYGRNPSVGEIMEDFK